MATTATRRGVLSGGMAAVALRLPGAGRSTAKIASRNQVDGTLRYYALGDSVASGHGLLDDGPPCRQSMHGYPFLLADKLREARPDLSIVFPGDMRHLLACSLSLSGNEGPHDLGQQVDELIVSIGPSTEQAVLVTITSGMNDIWGDAARFGELLLSILAMPDSVYVEWLESTIGVIAPNISHAVRRILHLGPNVAVVVSGYYNPINPLFLSSPLDPYLGLINSPLVSLWRAFQAVCRERDCYARTNQLIEALNTGLRVAVTEVGSDWARFDDSLYYAFKGHESVCGLEPVDAGETWVQSPVDRESNSLGSVFGRPEFVGLGDCIHPNTRGAHAIADSLESPALALLNLISPVTLASPEPLD